MTAGNGTCSTRMLEQDGMASCPQRWACLIYLRGSTGNAVTDNVWVGKGKHREENWDLLQRTWKALYYGLNSMMADRTD